MGVCMYRRVFGSMKVGGIVSLCKVVNKLQGEATVVNLSCYYALCTLFVDE